MTLFRNTTTSTLTRANKENNNSGDSVSHNVMTHIGLDTAAMVQAEFLPKSMGLHGIILIGQVHQHSILPLTHIQNSR